MLPVQFFTALSRRNARNGEKRLMIAILEDAAAVYCKHREPTTSKGRRLFRDTQRWLQSSDKKWIFSFERICEALDLDPSYLRRGLRMRRALAQARRAQPVSMPAIIAAADGAEPPRQAVGA
jgi:hypothetical protein